MKEPRMLTPLPDLLPQAQSWLEEDPDATTRSQLALLMEHAEPGNDAHRELAHCFSSSLQFGTAGLRAEMGPGPNRMNRVTVGRAAAGLAAYINSIEPPTHRSGHLVIVGYDGRHNSDVFARDTCEILTGAGIEVAVLPHMMPTPVLAFTVQHLGASAGVMVTASHNPAADNGYKVYLGPGVGVLDGTDYNGSQIISPQDTQISACIEKVGVLRDVPRRDDWLMLDHGVVGDYLHRALTALGDGPRKVRVVHTAMHGVGTEVFSQLCALGGFTDIAHVPQQALPDPDFPTVAFPNPEEPGALDLAFALAQEVTADVIIANDPDADRCAVAIVDQGHWRRLTGDEVGMLLAWWVVTRRALPTHTKIQWPADATLATSIVSSPWLADFATSQGLHFRETLTGFKWLAQIPSMVFGYEEALGYAVDPAAVQDKDGITAALVVMELAAHLLAQGSCLGEALTKITDEHGRWFTTQVSARMTDMTAVPTLMARLVASPPADIAGQAIVTRDDLSAGVDGLLPTDGVRWYLADGSRIIIRPSGTEPKVKCYIASRTSDAMSALAAVVPQLLTN
jgi:phosphomannomutase